MVAMVKKIQKVSDRLRVAIAAADKSLCQLARESEIDVATISRFMNCKGGLSVDGLDAIAAVLGLHLVEADGQKKSQTRRG
jgi:transcriptional regulator with XRE-family HTH domain